MPSNLHEWFLELFRNRSDSAPDLLRELHVVLPPYDQIRIESPNVNNLTPVEFRADLVLVVQCACSSSPLRSLWPARKQAEKNEALAVLSAFEHKDHPDPGLARRIVATTLAAIGNLDEARRDLYFDFIQLFMESTPKVLEDAMSSLKLHYEYDFVRRGVARGKTEGRVELILEDGPGSATKVTEPGRDINA